MLLYSLLGGRTYQFGEGGYPFQVIAYLIVAFLYGEVLYKALLLLPTRPELGHGIGMVVVRPVFAISQSTPPDLQFSHPWGVSFPVGFFFPCE